MTQLAQVTYNHFHNILGFLRLKTLDLRKLGNMRKLSKLDRIIG